MKRIGSIIGVAVWGMAWLAGCGPAADRTADRAAVQEVAMKIGADVRRIEDRTMQLALATAALYPDLDARAAQADSSRYGFAGEGAYYKKVEDGGPALWISGVVPVDEGVQKIAWATEGIDQDLMAIVREMPEVTQAYYNDCHSLNRIYPPFDVLSQYEPKMNIPEFNFYYLADAKHNPARKAVWVDEPYVDPAGRGWMVSCVAPVYFQEKLMGVVGLDVTVAGIVEHYLQPVNRAWALVDRKGTIVAATELAIQLFDMPPLADHRYVNTVRSDRYRSEDYNILLSPNPDVRKLADAVLKKGEGAARLRSTQGDVLVLAAPVSELGWTALLGQTP